MKNNRILNIVIFAISAAIIALFIPVQGMFKYDFSLGEIWDTKTLVAPYDFPLLKSNDEYKLDVNKQENGHINIYNKDLSLGNNALVGVMQYYSIEDNELLPAKFKTLSAERRRAVIIYNALKKVYQVGIIQLCEVDLKREGNYIVKIVDDGKLESKSRRLLYDLNKTKKFIFNELIKDRSIIKEDISVSEIEPFIIPNINFDVELNVILLKQARERVSKTKGIIKKESILIHTGDIVDQNKHDLINSLKKEHKRIGEREFSITPYMFNLLFVLIVLSLSYLSLYTFNRDFLNKKSNVIFLMLLYITFVIASYLVVNATFFSISIYLIPFAIFPFYINNFFGSKVSIYQYIFLLLIVSVLSPEPFDFLLINYLSGLAGMYLLKRAYHRNNFLRAVSVTLITSIILTTIMTMIQVGTLKDIMGVDYIWLFASAILLAAFYQLIYLIEKLFKFVSNITLVELGDNNHVLLLQLAEEAPGTFQHSMQVANLCESAAKAIGANHLLARVGAKYHDIGKSVNAMMFIENNSGKSMHDNLTALESADVIRNHVSDGIRLAKKYNIPNEILEFITSHHADSLIYFFYHAYINSNENENKSVDEGLFRYQGSKPVSKEASICMVADAIEAASRTLDKYTPDSFSLLVENIVSKKIGEGLMTDSKLTFKEMEIVKAAFKDKLSNIYHSRIEYPK